MIKQNFWSVIDFLLKNETKEHFSGVISISLRIQSAQTVLEFLAVMATTDAAID